MAAENGDGVQGCSVRTNSNHKSMLLEMDRILDATKMQGVALTRADAVLNAQLAIGYERQCSERRPGLRNAASDGTTRSVPPCFSPEDPFRNNGPQDVLHSHSHFRSSRNA